MMGDVLTARERSSRIIDDIVGVLLTIFSWRGDVGVVSRNGGYFATICGYARENGDYGDAGVVSRNGDISPP